METEGGRGGGGRGMGGHRAGTGWGRERGHRGSTRCFYVCVCVRSVVGSGGGWIVVCVPWQTPQRALLGSHMKRHGKRSHAYDLAPSVCQTLKTPTAMSIYIPCQINNILHSECAG